MTWKKIWSKRYSLRLAENWSFGTFHFEQKFGFAYPSQRIFIKDGFGYGYVNEQQLEAGMHIALDEIRERGFSRYFEDEAKHTFEEFAAYCCSLEKENLSNLSNQQLKEKLQEFLSLEDNWMHYVWLVFLLDEALTNELLLKLAKKSAQDQELLKMIAGSPIKKTAAYKQKTELLELAASNIPEEQIAKHLDDMRRKYEFFSILNMDEEPLSVSYFQDQFSEIKDAAQQLREQEQKQKSVEMLYGKIESTHGQELFSLIETCRKIAYYREYRNDLRQESYFHARVLYQEIGKRIGCPLSEIIFLTREEILSYLEGGRIDISVEKERKEFCCLCAENAHVKYVFAHDVVQQLFDEVQTAHKKGAIKGICAYPGSVKGTVIKVFDATKEHKITHKNVLVATTTNLAFIPLMSKAAAIVTDEGGLLTHTAVVARELEVPCIVGTKVATSLLEDGDMIFVDAASGVVKKL